MSWIGPAGRKALKYGPHVKAVWNQAGAPVTEAAQRAVASQAARRTALKHADTVVEGAILKVMDNGVTRWVVFSGGQPVAAYPQTSTQFSTLVGNADLSKMMTPEQVRVRQAERSTRQKALGTAQNVRNELRRRKG